MINFQVYISVVYKNIPKFKKKLVTFIYFLRPEQFRKIREKIFTVWSHSFCPHWSFYSLNIFFMTLWYFVYWFNVVISSAKNSQLKKTSNDLWECQNRKLAMNFVYLVSLKITRNIASKILESKICILIRATTFV